MESLFYLTVTEGSSEKNISGFTAVPWILRPDVRKELGSGLRMTATVESVVILKESSLNLL